MNIKNFFIAGIVGGIVQFLLGWLFYDVVFKAVLPSTDESQIDILMIFLGCLSLSFLVAFVLVKFSIVNYKSGVKYGAILGLFSALSMNFFKFSSQTFDLQFLLVDTFISILLLSIVGGVIAVINRKL